MPAFADVSPKRCPVCGGTPLYAPGVGVYCDLCGRLLLAETVPVTRPAPTEADRLRALLARFVALVESDKPVFRSDSRWGPLYRDAKAAVDAPPLPQEVPADAPPSR